MLSIWITIPVLGAVIGWITNRLAVRMLFRPRKPVRIPFTKWSFQGVLPRRKDQLARSIGETVERDLMSADTVVQFVRQNGYREQVVAQVAQHIEERLAASLPTFMPRSVVSVVQGYVGEIARRETASLVDRMEKTLTERLREDLSVSEIVEEKMRNFDLDELEELVTNVAAPELFYIELLGAVLGGVIGFAQVIVVLISRSLGM